MQISGTTALLGIIGNPVTHSLSPAMHNAALQASGLNAVYVPFPVSDVPTAVRGLGALGVKGVSVTIPHKEAVLSCIDVIDPVAAKIGAVNTVLFQQAEPQSVEIHGFNTDWIGSNTALRRHITLEGATALVVGAGGAAKAVGFGLVEAGARVMISNRTEESGRDLAALLQAESVSLADAGDTGADILINTTSVGMTPNIDSIVVPPSCLPRFKVVMDIVYAPLNTRLLQEAARAGCSVIDGLAMLLYQGMAQFEIWTGKKAPEEIMRQALEHALGQH